MLFVIHVTHNPFNYEGWNLPIVSFEREYEKLCQEARADIDHIIEAEKTVGLPIKAIMKEGNPSDEIIKVVKEENIDLMVMLGHEEGHIEHFLFGRDNEDLIRKISNALC